MKDLRIRSLFQVSMGDLLSKTFALFTRSLHKISQDIHMRSPGKISEQDLYNRSPGKISV